ncbi:nitrate/nitrite transporter NrtS [Paraglaciecola sp. 25GB23A]|uniref:nitrate/nitrite transporter NrtS n=1 Tax=Paraglaciecola sp. 25GB23A TaxID=3156068 RepID=UPI0032AE9ACE
MNKILRWFMLAIEIETLKRSIKVAVIVGTILMLINHGDILLYGDIEVHHLLKIVLTYLVPYLVSTYSSVESKLNH